MAKGPNAFRTISEAADEVGVPQHVLRFWEAKFTFISPMKRAGGRRFYRPQDVAVLQAVRRLLHEDGLTLRGVEKLHKTQGLAGLISDVAGRSTHGVEQASFSTPREQTDLLALADRLDAVRTRLDRVLIA